MYRGLTPEEIDSYMYQTVGHDAVHAVAAAIGVPLYRAAIAGAPHNQGSVYGLGKERADDETEDMYRLLRTVKAHHPDVEGVSAGAILSNYQRVRVEHIALREDIALQPLAYLWQRNQLSLLREMNTSGLVAILIKVAGIGLDDRDLGKSLQVLEPKLERLMQMYGAHVCGEGGEYETLSLDAPIFQRRVEITDPETVVHADAAFASVSYLRMPHVGLVDKEKTDTRAMQAPPLLDPISTAQCQVLRIVAPEKVSSAVVMVPWAPRVSVSTCGTTIGVGNVCGVEANGPECPAPSAAELEFEGEAQNALDTLLLTLAAHGFSREEIAHVNVYLASQSLFPVLNDVYSRYFGTSPPSRACVAVPGHGARVVLDAVAVRDAAQRRSLHVQSLSYWAPASIGPYSQAVLAGSRIFLAGQIGMEPATLAVLASDNVAQACLALQHVRRVVLATREWCYSAREGYVEGGVCWLADGSLAAAVSRLWYEPIDEDVSHAHTQQIPDAEWLGRVQAPHVPLLLVQLAHDGLPKHAAIEWQLTAHTGRHHLPTDDEEGLARPTYVAGSFAHQGVLCTYRAVLTQNEAFGAATLRATDACETDEAPSEILACLRDAVHAKLYYRESRAVQLLEALGSTGATTHVPAVAWGLVGDDLDNVGAAVTWFNSR